MNKSKAVIGLIDPKSPTNVGGVMRAAGCYRANAVLYSGTRYLRAARFNTDTHGAVRDIPLTGVASLLEHIPEDVKVVCVELVEGATPLPQYRHPDRAFYIFGPEDGTIAQEIIDRADDVVYVPTHGCMNLAATVNVVLYDRMAKSPLTMASDALIIQSRDTNTNVKVKFRMSTTEDESTAA